MIGRPCRSRQLLGSFVSGPEVVDRPRGRADGNRVGRDWPTDDGVRSYECAFADVRHHGAFRCDYGVIFDLEVVEVVALLEHRAAQVAKPMLPVEQDRGLAELTPLADIDIRRTLDQHRVGEAAVWA